MKISNKKFRFGAIAGIKPGFVFRECYVFPFPFYNHLKYFPGLPEAIEKLNCRIKIEEMRKNV